MKNLILAALVLQLVITIIEINGHDYNFGDIIVFPRGCFKEDAKPVYNHYGIYVGKSSRGNDDPSVGQGDNDIFHITRTKGLQFECTFDKIINIKGNFQEKDSNFLDKQKGFTVGGKKDIEKRIKETLNDCPKYDLTSSNCEHLATYVRYGERLSLQTGSLAEHFSAIRKETRDLLKSIIDDSKGEVECTEADTSG